MPVAIYSKLAFIAIAWAEDYYVSQATYDKAMHQEGRF
jgi:hypothetical protein